MSLSATAERLRAIRRAQEQFLAMHALECMWDQACERLVRDLAASEGGGEGDTTFSRGGGER